MPCRDLWVQPMSRLFPSVVLPKKPVSGKGGIYYYFFFKSGIIDAMIKRNHSCALGEGRELTVSSHLDAFQKLEIIYRACLDSSVKPKHREETRAFNERRESASIYQKFSRTIIAKLKLILTDITRQGVREGSIQCSFSEETVQITLTVITVTLDNHLVPSDDMQVGRTLSAFTKIREKDTGIPSYTFQSLTRKT